MAAIYTEITSEGGIVIPSDLREQMKLEPGTRVAIQREGNVLMLRPITREFIHDLIGSTSGAGDDREQTHRDDEER